MEANNDSLTTPEAFLKAVTKKKVTVKLKWGIEYVGVLESRDNYHNVELSDCEEWRHGQKEGYIGEVFIRCNNILYIRDLQGVTSR